MKSLQKFIELYTNADRFLEDARPHEEICEHIEINLFNYSLLPNGVPRWMIRMMMGFHPDYKKTESQILLIEERLIHPVIAIQQTLMKMWDVLVALHNIQTDLIISAGELDVIL